MDNHDRYYKGLFIGTLLGGIMGAALGVLFAPKKGEETRRQLKYYTQRYLEDTHVFITKPENENDHSNEARVRSEAVVETAREQAQTLLNDADSLLREIKSKTAKN